MLLKEGVITQQLCRHAINPWPSWEPLVQKVDALQGPLVMAAWEGRRADGGLARALIRNGPQMDPCGIQIGPDLGSVGCLRWHYSEVIQK